MNLLLEISDRRFFQFIKAKDVYIISKFHQHFAQQLDQTAILFLVKEDDLELLLQ